MRSWALLTLVAMRELALKKAWTIVVYCWKRSVANLVASGEVTPDAPW